MFDGPIICINSINYYSKMESMKIDSPNVHVDHNSEKPQNHDATVVKNTEIVQIEKLGALVGLAQMEICRTNHPAFESTIP